jgi:5,6-dimethylbenzimidazole synthase
VPVDDVDVVEKLVRWRRDVRHFKPDEIAEPLLARLLLLADAAPSVGLSQPWRVMRLESVSLRQRMQANFEQSNQAALDGYDGQQKQAYAALKLAGFDQAPVQLAVFCDQSPTQGHGLGRHSMPETLGYSCVCMIHTLWMAARAANVGMGWVSILDPAIACHDLSAPSQWQFIAYLLLGWPVDEHDVPELQRVHWEQRSMFDARWITR